MYFARTTRNSPDIPAAKAVSGRRYRCPVCDQPVFLRSGSYRVPHFAHLSKRADPKCALYHPGSEIVQPMPGQRNDAGQFDGGRKIVTAPYVAIALENRTRRAQNAGRRWQFGLVIPKASVGLGQLKVETGFGPLITLRLSTLMLGEKFVPINVDEHHGVKWVSDEVDYDYKSAVQQDINKIAPNDGYVFTGSGKIRTQIGILTWGETYILVWKNSDYSIPDTVDHYLIAENEGWSAAIVTLPTDQDEAVEAWLRDQFGASITSSVRQWGILYPPPLDRDADGNIRVGALSELFLGFSDYSDEDRSENAIATQIEMQTATINPNTDRMTVASILIPSNLDNYPLALTWGARALQPILLERRQSSEQTVALTLRTAVGRIQVALHQPAATAALLQVRAGIAEIISIHIPQGVAGALSVRERALAWTEVTQFKGVSGTSELNAEQLAQLTTWMRKRTADVRISFGCFGEFTAWAENLVSTGATLSKSLRDRLEWYLRLTGQSPARYGITSLSDAEIVEAVNAPTRNSAAVARQNLLLNELRGTMGATRER